MAATTLGIRHASKSKAAKKSSVFRPDIQGLRALAVLLVIADHMVAYPSGGFVGVDVFFVISGFLITGHLIKEQEKKGCISFSDFYKRRAKRILPLAIFVLAVTVAATWAIFATARALRITEDAVWSLLFSTNWHLAIIGTDYMQNDGTVSPLQHFWSLAVEEQFYVVWPWLVVLVMSVLATKLTWSVTKSRAVLAVVMLALTVGSFAFAMWETTNAPTVAYFSTFSRAWELGAGALLAALAPALSKIPAAIRPAMAWAGLLSILGGAFLITPEMPFPAPWAAVPVLATVMVIAAGTGHEAKYLAPLTNPVAGYLGNISYSLYLWHFPAIILISALAPLEGPMDYLKVLAVILALSAWSYHFVETPAREDGWLKRRRGKSGRLEGVTTRVQIGALSALAMLTVAVTAAAMAGPESTPPPAYATPLASSGATTAAAPTTPAGILAEKIDTALAAPAWPELTPSVDSLDQNDKATEWINDGCLGLETKALPDPVANAERCTYGDAAAPKTAVLMGDSVAISYLSGLRAALEPQGYKILVYTMQQCPAVDVTVLRADKTDFPECNQFREAAYAKVKETQPEMVILSNRHQQRLASGATGTAVPVEWQAGAKATFERLSADTANVVVMDGPPGGAGLMTCATKVSKPEDCDSTPSGEYRDLSAASHEAAAGLAKVKYLDTLAWFCSTQRGSCPSFVGTTPVYVDGTHLTSTYSASLGTVITEALTGVS